MVLDTRVGEGEGLSPSLHIALYYTLQNIMFTLVIQFIQDYLSGTPGTTFRHRRGLGPPFTNNILERISNIVSSLTTSESPRQIAPDAMSPAPPPRREKHDHSRQLRRTVAPNITPGASSQRLYLQAALFAALSVAAAALAMSYLWCPAVSWMDDIVPTDSQGWSYCADKHYKYLVPLLIPVTVWFSIANWVGWTYFRFA